jgi:hypothetical protein
MPSDSVSGSRASRLAPAAAYFGLVFAAGFVLGSIRVPLLVPRLGVRLAELLEMPFMLAVIVLAARFVVRRFELATRPRRDALLAGGLALVLLLAAEALVAVVIAGQTVRAYVAGRDPVAGSVYAALLIVFAALPALFARGRRAPR